jgi:1,4-dihydroxy-2-naphthoate octaprenyltransferase
LPAIAIGLLSGVLNLNNMRDEASDRKVGKNTLVVKIGGKKQSYTIIYFSNFAMALMVVFAIINNFKFDQYLFLLAYIPLTKHLSTVYKTKILAHWILS